MALTSKPAESNHFCIFPGMVNLRRFDCIHSYINLFEGIIYKLTFLITYIKTRPTHQRTDANLYPLERQLTKASEPVFDLEGGAKGQFKQHLEVGAQGQI